jgi:hypothetical protein
MHAWIGFFFSCTMIILAALGKSGYIWVPDSMAATPATEFMFLIGCAGFGAALAMIAPSYSTARLASLWSSAALVFVVLIANVDDFNPHGNEIRTARPAVIVPAKPDMTPPNVKLGLKNTIHEDDWVPFKDFERRVTALERRQRALPANTDSHETAPQKASNSEQ